MLLHLVISLPLFICDCWVLCHFSSGIVFLHICHYDTVRFIKEEAETANRRKSKYDDYSSTIAVFALKNWCSCLWFSSACLKGPCDGWTLAGIQREFR